VYPAEFTEQLYLSILARGMLTNLRIGTQYRGRRLFVSRRPNVYSRNKRYALNNAEVEAAVSAIGFQVVLPETMTATQQIQLFSEAEIVVGAAGAGLFNSVFCMPGTILVDIESEVDWVGAHANLFSSLGLRYSIHWAAPVDDRSFSPPHRPFTIDVKALMDQLGRLMSQQST
jgi:capsular polysaccharide biosynthesis protein